MGRVHLRAGLVAAVLALTVAPAAAQGAVRQTASADFTSEAVSEPTGLDLAIDYLPGGPDADSKPWAVKKVVTRLPEGTRIDSAAVPRCTASDLILMLRGPSACPAGSVIGGGRLSVDTGILDLDVGEPGPLRNIVFDVSLLNNTGQQIFVLRPISPVSLPTPFIVTRATVTGRTITSTVPPIPGLPPPDAFTAIKRVRLAINHRDSDYLTTPDTCSGTWTSKLAFTYSDGITQHVSSTDSCV